MPSSADPVPQDYPVRRAAFELFPLPLRIPRASGLIAFAFALGACDSQTTGLLDGEAGGQGASTAVSAAFDRTGETDLEIPEYPGQGEEYPGQGEDTEEDQIDETGGSKGDAPPRPTQALPAFPGAEGYGALALSECRSRPLRVHKVTQTGSTGTGSLYDILTNRVSRDRYDIVVFETGGTIATHDKLPLSTECIYIAGQTAPGDGIQIRARNGAQLVVFATSRYGTGRHIAMRYLRIRQGDSQTGKGANISLASGEHIILDHISTAWSNDENISVFPVKASNGGRPINNVTIQWSMVTSGLWNHSMGLLVAGSPEGPWPSDISLHHNALIHNGFRNPLLGGVRCAQVINNLVYNWRGRIGNIRNGVCADYIGNYWKQGPWTRGSKLLQAIIDESRGYTEDPTLFMSGNVGDPWQLDPSAPQSTFIQYGRDRSGSLSSSAFVSAPQAHPKVQVRIHSASNAYEAILDQAGASRRVTCSGEWIEARDRTDDLFASHVRDRTGPGTDEQNDSESDYGGFPNLAAGSPCADRDGDGMPDDFETRFGLNPDNPGDADADADADGYLNIEEYLNGRPARSGPTEAPGHSPFR